MSGDGDGEREASELSRQMATVAVAPRIAQTRITCLRVQATLCEVRAPAGRWREGSVAMDVELARVECASTDTNINTSVSVGHGHQGWRNGGPASSAPCLRVRE